VLRRLTGITAGAQEDLSGALVALGSGDLGRMLEYPLLYPYLAEQDLLTNSALVENSSLPAFRLLLNRFRNNEATEEELSSSFGQMLLQEDFSTLLSAKELVSPDEDFTHIQLRRYLQEHDFTPALKEGFRPIMLEDVGVAYELLHFYNQESDAPFLLELFLRHNLDDGELYELLYQNLSLPFWEALQREGLTHNDFSALLLQFHNTINASTTRGDYTRANQIINFFSDLLESKYFSDEAITEGLNHLPPNFTLVRGLRYYLMQEGYLPR